MQPKVHQSATGNPTYRGYVIAASKGSFMVCGQTFATLDEATADIDAILAKQDEDICPDCRYHVTRCRCAPF